MSGSERRVTGLKAHAEANLFADWRVTPSLIRRLEAQIQQAEERRRSRAWLAPAAVGVATLTLFAVLGRGFTGGTSGEPGVGSSAAAQVPDRLRPAAAAGNPPVIGLAGEGVKVTILDQAGLQVRGSDAYGSTVSLTTTASNLDKQGAAVPTVATTVTGVEVQPGKKLILNGDYTIRVKDLQPVIAALQQLAAARGGYVVETTVNRADDGSAAARIVLRLPADQFGAAIGSVGEMGEVQRQQVWSQDVTNQFIDQESSLKVLTEHEEKLQELARSAANFDDWLRLAKQINETRAQIESLQGSLKQLANQVAFSTLNIALVQPVPGKYAASTQPGSVGAQMGSAFRESVLLIGSVVRWSLVGLSAAVPFLVPLGLVGGGIWVGLRRRRSV